MCGEGSKEYLLLSHGPSLWVTLFGSGRTYTHGSKHTGHKSTFKPLKKEVIRPTEMFSPSGKITSRGPGQLPKKISKYVTQPGEATTGRQIPDQLESVMIGKTL